MPLEPLPETREALDTMGLWTHHDVLAELSRQADLVEAVVPSGVG